MSRVMKSAIPPYRLNQRLSRMVRSVLTANLAMLSLAGGLPTRVLAQSSTPLPPADLSIPGGAPAIPGLPIDLTDPSSPLSDPLLSPPVTEPPRDRVVPASAQPRDPKADKPQKKQPPPNEFPPNPLEITQPYDPLIPFDYGKRPLTTEERQTLVKAADRLAIIGAQRSQAKDPIGAYAAWNQELRYRRAAAYLVDEVRALGRIGDVAWLQNNNLQLRYITQRLDAIRLQTERPIAELERDRDTPPEYVTAKQRSALIEALAIAYQQVRLPKVAAVLFEQVLAKARQDGDSLKVETILLNLGQLHLGWFAYDKAAVVYRELWQRSQSRQDLINEPLYLKLLIFIHEQAKQPKETIFYAQQAIEFYRKINDPKPVPALMTKIADNQRTLKQLDRAEANYQLAYRVAQAQLQWADAAEALKHLAEMYRNEGRISAAERIYAFLVNVEQQAYSAYGVMDAYDQLGVLQLNQEAYPEAIVAFEKGLAVARQLKIREDYFLARIDNATNQLNAPQPLDILDQIEVLEEPLGLDFLVSKDLFAPSKPLILPRVFIPQIHSAP